MSFHSLAIHFAFSFSIWHMTCSLSFFCLGHESPVLSLLEICCCSASPLGSSHGRCRLHAMPLAQKAAPPPSPSAAAPLTAPQQLLRRRRSRSSDGARSSPPWPQLPMTTATLAKTTTKFSLTSSRAGGCPMVLAASIMMVTEPELKLRLFYSGPS